jgi:hypothetical protein
MDLTLCRRVCSFDISNELSAFIFGAEYYKKCVGLFDPEFDTMIVRNVETTHPTAQR